MDEQKKYEVIKSLADHPDGNKERAALTLGCRKKQFRDNKKFKTEFYLPGGKTMVVR